VRLAARPYIGARYLAFGGLPWEPPAPGHQPKSPPPAGGFSSRRPATTAAAPLQTEGRKALVTVETGVLGNYRESYSNVAKTT
jgi:hypothetical protein